MYVFWRNKCRCFELITHCLLFNPGKKKLSLDCRNQTVEMRLILCPPGGDCFVICTCYCSWVIREQCCPGAFINVGHCWTAPAGISLALEVFGRVQAFLLSSMALLGLELLCMSSTHLFSWPESHRYLLWSGALLWLPAFLSCLTICLFGPDWIYTIDFDFWNSNWAVVSIFCYTISFPQWCVPDLDEGLKKNQEIFQMITVIYAQPRH